MQMHGACAAMLMLAAASPAVADGGQRAALSAPAAAFVGQPMFRGGQFLAPRARLSACTRPRRAAPHTAVQANSKVRRVRASFSPAVAALHVPAATSLGPAGPGETSRTRSRTLCRRGPGELGQGGRGGGLHVPTKPLPLKL